MKQKKFKKKRDPFCVRSHKKSAQRRRICRIALSKERAMMTTTTTHNNTSRGGGYFGKRVGAKNTGVVFCPRWHHRRRHGTMNFDVRQRVKVVTATSSSSSSSSSWKAHHPKSRATTARTSAASRRRRRRPRENEDGVSARWSWVRTKAASITPSDDYLDGKGVDAKYAAHDWLNASEKRKKNILLYPRTKTRTTTCTNSRKKTSR